MKRWPVFPFIFCLLFFLVAQTTGMNITGSYSAQLNTPVTPEISSKSRTAAKEAFKKDLLSWLRENVSLYWDTANAIDNLHFNAFARSCISRAKETSLFDGPKWTVSYALSTDDVPDKIAEWNILLDTLALRSFRGLTATGVVHKPPEMYTLGVQTIFYAKGRIGKPLTLPEQPTMEIVSKAKSILDEALKGFNITSSEMVIQGKPGTFTQKGLTVQVKTDSFPMPGIALRVILPSGKCIYNGITNDRGELVLEHLRIPYVNNGSFLYIRPNPGVLIDSASVFLMSDLGLIKPRSTEQTLIFKLARPSIALNYRASAVSNFEIPKDFSDNTTMLKFLKDSCRFDIAPVTSQPDLIIDMLCQVSSYSQDKTEQTLVKTDMLITIKEASSAESRSASTTVNFEKAYENGPPLPVGLYFWEAAAMLRKTIRTTLESL
jgi:hypothetical protein